MRECYQGGHLDITVLLNANHIEKGADESVLWLPFLLMCCPIVWTICIKGTLMCSYIQLSYFIKLSTMFVWV